MTGLVVQHRTEEQQQKKFVPPPPPIVPWSLLNRMQNELQLSQDQRDRIEKIIKEGQARMKILWDLIGPEVGDERRHVIEDIRAQSQPDQLEKFEQVLKHKPPPPWVGRGPRSRSTNDPGAKPGHPPGERN